MNYALNYVNGSILASTNGRLYVLWTMLELDVESPNSMLLMARPISTHFLELILWNSLTKASRDILYS